MLQRWHYLTCQSSRVAREKPACDANDEARLPAIQATLPATQAILPATQAILPALLSRLVEEACQTGVTRTPKPSRQMSPGTSHIDPNLFPHACMVCGWTDERWCPHQTCFAGPLQPVHTLWPAVFTLPLTLTAALLRFRGRAAG